MTTRLLIDDQPKQTVHAGGSHRSKRRKLLPFAWLRV